MPKMEYFNNLWRQSKNLVFPATLAAATACASEPMIYAKQIDTEAICDYSSVPRSLSLRITYRRAANFPGDTFGIKIREEMSGIIYDENILFRDTASLTVGYTGTTGFDGDGEEISFAPKTALEISFYYPQAPERTLLTRHVVFECD